MNAPDDWEVDPSADAAREEMQRFVIAHGVDYANGKVNEITGPSPECWTNAWRAHLATGRTYVEGICLLRGEPHAHAWTVDTAGIVYEHTEGYERAGAYHGFPFDTSPGSEAAEMSARVYAPSEPRTSMLEGCLGAGAPWPLIVRNLGRSER